MVICEFTMQTNVDKDQVKAAIKAQQDQQINNASVLNFKSVTTGFFFLNFTMMTFLFYIYTFSFNRHF